MSGAVGGDNVLPLLWSVFIFWWSPDGYRRTREFELLLPSSTFLIRNCLGAAAVRVQAPVPDGGGAKSIQGS